MAENPTQWLRQIHQIAATAEDQKQFIVAVRELCHETFREIEISEENLKNARGR
jgi:hypothetical protein